MKLSEYIQSKPVGEIRRLANAISAFEPDVSRWVSGKRAVPIWRCADIEKFTCGEVSRKDLRPDDWHLIWPELATTEVPHA